MFKPDGDSMRRVVPSPLPKRIFELHAIEGAARPRDVVICAGGGGIPTMYTDEPAPAGRRLVGVEAVIDKDLASALLAHRPARRLAGHRHRRRRRLRRLGHPRPEGDPPRSPEALRAGAFAEGSMGPKVRAACEFVEKTGNPAAIGSIAETVALLHGEAGTTVAMDAAGLETVKAG